MGILCAHTLSPSTVGLTSTPSTKEMTSTEGPPSKNEFYSLDQIEGTFSLKVDPLDCLSTEKIVLS